MYQFSITFQIKPTHIVVIRNAFNVCASWAYTNLIPLCDFKWKLSSVTNIYAQLFDKTLSILSVFSADTLLLNNTDNTNQFEAIVSTQLVD